MEEATIARDYTWPVKITTFDAGQDQRLTPAGQLRLQQEIGELHMRTGGLGYQVLCDAGMAFLLTRTNSVVHRAPALNEEVALRTWHRGTRGAQFYRCYEFLDKAGEKLIESVTAFALVDVRDHRLLLPDAFEPYGLLTQPERRNDCPDPVKWKQPDDMKPAGDHVVRWSEVDWNGHLNNTIYANYLCDYLPGGMKGKRLTGFSIAFVKEAVEGETLHMTAAEREGEAFVTGAHDRGVCFDARLSFVPEP